jgi:hypothetical protein
MERWRHATAVAQGWPGAILRRARYAAAVPISTKPTLSFGAAERLFSNPALDWMYVFPTYDVSAEGRRLVLIEPKGPLGKPAIRLVQNWFAEFREGK